jgi:hypothetical protein
MDLPAWLHFSGLWCLAFWILSGGGGGASRRRNFKLLLFSVFSAFSRGPRHDGDRKRWKGEDSSLLAKCFTQVLCFTASPAMPTGWIQSHHKAITGLGENLCGFNKQLLIAVLHRIIAVMPRHLTPHHNPTILQHLHQLPSALIHGKRPPSSIL